MSTLQDSTMRLYGELLARTPAGGWAGKLVVTAGAGSSSHGLPAAVCIAGGVCLALDPDHDRVRATFRDAGFDFLVNTLDEAIRVLKNEVRRGRPLAVALTSEPVEALAEMRDRGLLADLAVNAPEVSAWMHLASSAGPSSELNAWLAAQGWAVRSIPRDQAIPAFAAEDPRHAWLRLLPRYQRSAAREPRAIWLRDDEL